MRRLMGAGMAVLGLLGAVGCTPPGSTGPTTPEPTCAYGSAAIAGAPTAPAVGDGSDGGTAAVIVRSSRTDAPPLPTTPCFAGRQSHFGPAPDGMGVGASAGWPGANGSNVRVVDLEYSWNPAHEDLSAARRAGAFIPLGTPEDPFDDSSHGTAVLGILAGDRNSFGVNGIVPDAEVHMVNTNTTDGIQVDLAISTAAASLQPGDVIVIEQQTWGVGADLVPVEWKPEVYDAIRAATGRGINVVEAAGNGSGSTGIGINLDGSTYGPRFPAGKADSGAIIVGAGSACPGRPQRSRMAFSNYGSRVDVQGAGECVATTGYGDLQGGDPNQLYTAFFSGTSSATALVGGVVAALSSAYEQSHGVPASPATIRSILKSTGTAQSGSTSSGRIGPLPNLPAALAALG